MMTSIVGQRALLDPLQQLDAVELGHLQIGHDHVEPPGGELFEGFLAVGGGDHLVPLRGQIVGQGDAFDLFVVDDKDSHAFASHAHSRSTFEAADALWHAEHFRDSDRR